MGLLNLLDNKGKLGLAGLAAAAILSCSNPIQPPNNDNPSNPNSNSPPHTPSMQAISGAIEPNRMIQLVVTDSYGDETGFNVEKATAGGGFVPLTNLGSGQAQIYDDWNITMSTPYKYRVRAVNNYGDSSWYTVNTAGVGPQTGNITLGVSQNASISPPYPADLGTQVFGQYYLQVSGPNSAMYGAANSLLQFPSMPPLPSYALGFKDAYLNMQDASAGGSYPTGFELFGELITGSWNPGTVTWDNQPAVSSYGLESTQISTNSSGQINSVTLDVSNIVSAWYSGTANNGIELYTPTSGAFWDFYSIQADQTYNMPNADAQLDIQYLW